MNIDMLTGGIFGFGIGVCLTVIIFKIWINKMQDDLIKLLDNKRDKKRRVS